VATAGWDQAITLWDVPSGRARAHLDNTRSIAQGSIFSVAFSPDGKTLASGSLDGQIELWEVATGKLQATLKGHEDDVQSVAFSPDGKTLASASHDGTVKLWDVASGKEQATLSGHHFWVWSVAFSPDGKTLASGSYDRTVKLWDVQAVPASHSAMLWGLGALLFLLTAGCLRFASRRRAGRRASTIGVPGSPSLSVRVCPHFPPVNTSIAQHPRT
jgi:WD40 repeat protein